MDKKKIHVTREYEKKMSEISPFELKNILIELADESARKSTHIMLKGKSKLDQYGSTGGILPIRAVRLGGMPAGNRIGR